MDQEQINPIEILFNRLYWITSYKSLQNNIQGVLIFDPSKEFTYNPIAQDFGPYDIGQIHKFCKYLIELLNNAAHKDKKIFYYCKDDPKIKANSILLICSFQVIVLKRTPKESIDIFAGIQVPGFRDSSPSKQISPIITILDCLEGLFFAIKFKWYDLETFNLQEYQFYSKVSNGDINWIIPGKFLAFKSPHVLPDYCCSSLGDICISIDYSIFRPVEFYLPILKKFGIKHVIRLNEPTYDKRLITEKGIDFSDLYFEDCTPPSTEIMQTFLQIVEKHDYPFAIHCKAGRGRTGTLIAAYAIKNYKIPAEAMIAWCRLCRLK